MHCRTEYRTFSTDLQYKVNHRVWSARTMFWTGRLELHVGHVYYDTEELRVGHFHPAGSGMCLPSTAGQVRVLGLYQNHLCTLATRIFKGNKRLRKWPRGFRARVNNWRPWGTKRDREKEREVESEGGGEEEKRERERSPDSYLWRASHS
jgi:hypothetical protein